MRVSQASWLFFVVLSSASPALARCHYDRMKFYYDGASVTSEGIADSGVACVSHHRGRRMLSIDITRQPEHGAATVSPGDDGKINVTYISAKGYTGPDSFTFTVHGVHIGKGGDYLAAGIPGVSTQTINMTVE